MGEVKHMEDRVCCCGEYESRHTIESGHSFVDAHEHEIEQLTRERDEAREELSAFKACHGIGRVEDGYREVIWREASEFFQAECNIVPLSDHEAALAEARDCLKKVVAEEREACAHVATSFLVGDPAKGVPLRNPMAYEIADRIRARGKAEPTNA